MGPLEADPIEREERAQDNRNFLFQANKRKLLFILRSGGRIYMV